MDEQFGAGYAPSVAADQSLRLLGGVTAQAALQAGASPREVWLAVCDAYEIPEYRSGVAQ